jgi:hypothetical protein
MRTTILAAITAFVIGGAATGAFLAEAQQPPPSPPGSGMMGQGMMGQGMMGSGMMGSGMMGSGMMGGHPMPPRPWMQGMRRMHGNRPAWGTFGLVFRHEDRQLAPADVQKIAEAFLLWNGNHAWKIVEVAATPDGPIAFSVATQEGSVIAKFTMDPHTGRVTRVG